MEHRLCMERSELIEHFLAKMAVIMDLTYFLGVCSYRYGII